MFFEAPGFARSEYGARNPNQQGTVLDLRPGQEVRAMVIQLLPASVISGRIEDNNRRPAVRAEVQVMRYRYHNGRRQLLPVATATTDTVGEYRIGGLGPGRYFVCASASTASRDAEDLASEDFVPTFYPGVPEPASAFPVTVGVAAEVGGVTFSLAKTLVVRVTGRVRNDVTDEVVGAVLMLEPADTPELQIMRRRTVSLKDPQGRFELRNVPPGSYTLTAEWFDDDRRFIGSVAIQVGKTDLDRVEINLLPTAGLAGKTVVEGSHSGAIKPSTITLRSREASMVMALSDKVAEDGSFLIQHVGKQRYMIEAGGLPPGVYVKAIRMGDREVSGQDIDFSSGVAPIEVVLSTSGGAVSGIVKNGSGSPGGGSTVLLIPELAGGGAAQGHRTIIASKDGSFSASGIAPGSYRLVAGRDIDSNWLAQPESLKLLEQFGRSVSFRENSSQSMQLELLPADASSH